MWDVGVDSGRPSDIRNPPSAMRARRSGRLRQDPRPKTQDLSKNEEGPALLPAPSSFVALVGGKLPARRCLLDSSISPGGRCRPPRCSLRCVPRTGDCRTGREFTQPARAWSLAAALLGALLLRALFLSASLSHENLPIESEHRGFNDEQRHTLQRRRLTLLLSGLSRQALQWEFRRAGGSPDLASTGRASAISAVSDAAGARSSDTRAHAQAPATLVVDDCHSGSRRCGSATAVTRAIAAPALADRSRPRAGGR